jgi:hypothetical protein
VIIVVSAIVPAYPDGGVINGHGIWHVLLLG